MAGEVVCGRWRKVFLEGMLRDVQTEFVEVVLAKVDGSVTIDFKAAKEVT